MQEANQMQCLREYLCEVTIKREGQRRENKVSGERGKGWGLGDEVGQRRFTGMNSSKY